MTDHNVDRRDLMRLAGVAAAGLAVAGDIGSGPALAKAPAAQAKQSIYERMLGVRPYVNAAGPVTAYGGTLLSKEVSAAMAEAARNYVDLHDLYDAAGTRLAKLLQTESAMVTSGAFCAMTLAGAACLIGGDKDKIAMLPHPNWERTEVLIPPHHTTAYDQAYKNIGLKVHYVGSEQELLQSIGERTAMIAGLIQGEKLGVDMISTSRLVEIGKQHKVPVYLDASFTANLAPPNSELWHYTTKGADLVGISGGKGLHAPQSTGILAGRSDLIALARSMASPNISVGRGFKVDKEEVIGLLVAVDQYMARDHALLQKRDERRVDTMRRILQDVPDLKFDLDTGFFGPGLILSWDQSKIPLSYNAFVQKLREGEPSIITFIAKADAPYFSNTVGGPGLFADHLEDGEDQLVAHKARELLLHARHA